MARFEQAGLKEQAQSWIAKGKNLPVTAAQVKAALGPELERLAQKAGFQVMKSFPESAYHFPVKTFSRNICLLVKKND